jgi:peptide-methionine (S)-S-oxide reductase
MRSSRLNYLWFFADAIVLSACATLFITPLRAAERPVVIPAPLKDIQTSEGVQTIVLSGGCFWGVQGVFQHTAGVVSAISGYAGGSRATANYVAVSSHTTGHAESVQVNYDPKKISYGKVLQIFFSVVHDPTQLNRQGPDSGTQYRSAIFTTTNEQRNVADGYIQQLDATNIYKKPIVTKVGPLVAFYPAEPEHQDYLALNAKSSFYIIVNDIPKVENLKKLFAESYLENPTLVNGAIGSPSN